MTLTFVSAISSRPLSEGDGRAGAKSQNAAHRDVVRRPCLSCAGLFHRFTLPAPSAASPAAAWRWCRLARKSRRFAKKVEDLGQLALHIDQRLRVGGRGRGGCSGGRLARLRGHDRRNREVGLQLLLRASNREAFGVEQLLDAQDDVDLMLRVKPLPPAALVRCQRRKLRLPVAKDVGLYICQATDLSDLVEAILHRPRL